MGRSRKSEPQGALVFHQAGPSTVLGVAPWLVMMFLPGEKSIIVWDGFTAVLFVLRKKMDGNTDR